MEGQLKITLGMSELLVIGSMGLHQYAFMFSIVLLVLGISGKIIAFAMTAAEKKEKEESGKELVKNIIDSVSNAVTLGNIVNSKDNNGFH